MRKYRLHLTKHPYGILIEKQYKFLWWWIDTILYQNTLEVKTNDNGEIEKWKQLATEKGWGIKDDSDYYK